MSSTDRRSPAARRALGVGRPASPPPTPRIPDRARASPARTMRPTRYARAGGRGPRRGLRAGAQDNRVDAGDPTAGSAGRARRAAGQDRAAIDEQAPAPRALDEDRVALPDVQDRHVGRPERPLDDDRRRQDDRRARAITARRVGRATELAGLRRGPSAGHRRVRVTAEGARPRGRRRRHSIAATAPTLPIAATTFDGGSSVTLANGTRRRTATIATMIASVTQPGAARTAAIAAGAPAQRGARRQARRRPRPSRRDERDDARGWTRARSGRAGRTMARMTGSVAACAASETPRLSASQRGTRPPPTDRSARQRRRPGDQPGRRERRQLEARVGDQPRVGEEQQLAAQPSAAAARPARPVSRASKTTPAISAARTTDAEPRRSDVGEDREDRSGPTVGGARASGQAPRSRPRRSRCSSRRWRRRGSRRPS